MAVEMYRYGTHPDCDMRPLGIAVVVKRTYRFSKVSEKASKAANKKSGSNRIQKTRSR